MELVNVNLYAEGYYSGATYEDNIWIKESSYERLRDIFPTEISCGELDGKHSEVMGEVEIQNNWHTDEDFAKAGRSEGDGDRLELELVDLYNEHGLDWDAEQDEIDEYFDGLDIWKDVTITLPESKIPALRKYADCLIYNDDDKNSRA